MELAQHPTAGEVVAATHGRSLWALDATPIRAATPANLKEKATLFRPAPVVRWRNEPARGTTNRKFVATNPQAGASIYVNVAAKPTTIALKVVDGLGTTMRDLRVPSDPGLHRIAWDLLRPAPPPAARPTPSTGLVGGFVAGMRRGLNNSGRQVRAAPGPYRVVLTVDGKDQVQPLTVESDPAYPTAEGMAEGFFEEVDDEEEGGDKGAGGRID